MNAEKLKKLQASVRIGGKGTPRRKKKIVHQTAATDDKKLQSSLKKLSVNTIPGIEEVNMIRDDGTVIHFNNPKAQASLAANTFAITGHGEHKQVCVCVSKYGINMFASCQRAKMFWRPIVWAAAALQTLRAFSAAPTALSYLRLPAHRDMPQPNLTTRHQMHCVVM